MRTPAKCLILQIPFFLFLVSFAAFGADVSALPQDWIITNKLGDLKCLTNYMRQLDLTVDIREDFVKSSKIINSPARLLLSNREGLDLVTFVTAKGIVGDRIVANYDVRSSGTINTKNMTERELYNVWKTNRTILKFGFYRGRIYYIRNNIAFSHDWISVFTSENKARIVVASDSGPIYYSQNSGALWNYITQPGWYEFAIAKTPRGSAVVASASISKVSGLSPVQTVNDQTNQWWYAAVSAADGSELVFRGGDSIFTPVLTLVNSGGDTIVSWSDALTGYTLQQNGSLMTDGWVNVTNSPVDTNFQFEVILRKSAANQFFRLKAH